MMSATLLARSGFRRNRGGVGRLKLRLAAAGWGFVGLVLCGFLMSVNFSNNLIFAMTFLLLGIALVGGWQTGRNLVGLSQGDWRSDPVFAGESVVYRLNLHNPSRMARLGVMAAIQGERDGKAYTLAALDAIELELRRPTTHRGRLEQAAAVLTSRFPIGLIEARLSCGRLPECWVYPAPRGDQRLPEHAQGQQAHQRHESGNFTEMRRYAPGDPPSRIAWQALARTDEIYTKEFDGAEGQPALWLSWDAVAASGVENKLSQLCRWVLDAQRAGREYGLDIPGVRIDPAADESHQRRCLQALALYEIEVER